MLTRIMIVVVGAGLALAGAQPAAQSPSELLERGVYLEETVGDVDQAIGLYEQIASDATASRSHVAEALFRLGMCHLKRDDAAAAREVFDRVITDFTDQGEFVARARENRPADPGILELGPAPWPDGEVMRLGLKLESGVPIGAMWLTADATEVDGDAMWRLRIRRKIFSSPDNQSISEVVARQDDMAPVSGLVKHALVGHYEAAYGYGGASITTIGPNTTRDQKLEGRVFDSEEIYQLLRRLPLEVGYRATIHAISTVAGGANPLDVEITGQEMVTVPAGEFECFRMSLGGRQTNWYSTDPSHYMVKVEAEGIIAELTEVYEQEPGQEIVRRDDESGFTVAAPPDWLVFATEENGVDVLLLLDPMADTEAVVTIHRPQGTCLAQSAALNRVEAGQVRCETFEMRDGSWTERAIAGRPSISFVGDCATRGRDVVHYWTYIESGELCVEFEFTVDAARFDDHRDALEAIVTSYDGPRPQTARATEPESESARAVKAVLTDFHLAASNADTERYFSHLTPDFVFLGTDLSERFDIDQLRSLVEPYFSRGVGWVAAPVEQNVFVAEDGSLAWFDEKLDSRNFGEMRVNGLLREENGRWRIVRYSVGFPVPNALVGDLVDKIVALDGGLAEVPADFPPAPADADTDPASAVRAVLRDFHLAASEANEKRYFEHLAADVVYFGTDRSERFTLAETKAFVGPYLARGTGWTSVPVDQKVFLSQDGSIAWFEERLARAQIGEMRSTGVLRLVDGRWKITHYNLVIPVPNELAEGLVEEIRAFYGS